MKRSLVSRVSSRLEQLSVRLRDRTLNPSTREEYCIPLGYTHRTVNCAYDDRGSTDDWQREVYEAAAKYSADTNAKLVYDVGCGSGYKLVKYFPEVKTVGFDTLRTVSWLQSTYQDHDWRVSKLDEPMEDDVDVVICADVIEHIPDPDILMRFLSALRFKVLFLSTPDRDSVYPAPHRGPPENLAHCREWNMRELQLYLSNWFHVEEHCISNRAQATQMVVLSKRSR